MRFIHSVGNMIKINFQLRNRFLFEKFMALGSIMPCVYGDAMQSIQESNSWSRLGWARYRRLHHYTAYFAFLWLCPENITVTNAITHTEEAICFYRHYVIIVPTTSNGVIINNITSLQKHHPLWIRHLSSDKTSSHFCKHAFILYETSMCSFCAAF